MTRDTFTHAYDTFICVYDRWPTSQELFDANLIFVGRCEYDHNGEMYVIKGDALRNRFGNHNIQFVLTA